MLDIGFQKRDGLYWNSVRSRLRLFLNEIRSLDYKIKTNTGRSLNLRYFYTSVQGTKFMAYYLQEL